MSTYFKGEQKLVISNIVDVNSALIVPPSGSGNYTVYTMPSDKYGLFQLFKKQITGGGDASSTCKAKTRPKSYTGLNTDIKTFPLFTVGTTNYDPQETSILTTDNLSTIGLDPFTYLRTLDSLIKQAQENNYCALLGPQDLVTLTTFGYDPDNALYLSYRVYEIDII